MAQRTILVADDDASIRSLLKQLLTDQGYAVLEAATGSEVVEQVKDSGPDLVIMDLRMPELDGIEALQKVKTASPRTAVPIMTAFGTAEALHYNSTRRSGPLVKVSCAALPETLLEAELFGHEKGSFTGAMATRKGRFELADKGTIFLDEIGEMSLATQTKLLRVLQERKIERVGSSLPIKVDIRVIVATNKELQKQVEQGKFRDDLFYRLNVINIHMPPLRERKEDISALVEHFLAKHRYSASAQPATISEEALKRLVEYDWPGNVRELENVVERAVVLSRGQVNTSRELPFGDHEAEHDGEGGEGD